ncbi:hypothetical protein ACQV2W_00655 [Facklamia sp. P12934]|uniref:hypothetical protein n=1 Tax=Facklamia sp. P12934 TaxID=3421948 RepID=UPI003D1778F3
MFRNKEDNKKNKRKEIIGEDGKIYVEKRNSNWWKWILGLFILGTIGNMLEGNKDNNNPKTDSVVSITTVETTKEFMVSKEPTTEEPTTEEPTTTTEELSKKFDEDANGEFAQYIMDFINGQLESEGFSEKVQVQYHRSNLLYILVPQDYKYFTNAEIQQTADSLLLVKNNIFKEFAIQNGYELGDAPNLYIKTEDGTLLAKEGILSGKMERKYSN